ncbi:hypothetical protein ACFQI3_13900 [Hansschlegelia quercus]|uniref:Uncharacterized protein n=1 Tax=Hansschlegelia quercus TaxID=2528245 RepID=A0A4V2JDG4_9HYPH|nr:hypothetical protein [Hansschlegelia quercus]TBN48704.1 hypothetical protein EYR15_14050 [Hansschlegelia quercus]
MDDLLQFVLAWPGYWTARLIVPTVTFGAVDVERPTDKEGTINCMGVGRRADGTILIGGDLILLVALVIWAVLIAGGVFVSWLF